jgi:protein-tyrosine-phosphatase/tRNA A37 threonylcarbamoyladenosine synthetase subunit TsaC/SUA5/YrdC
MPRILEWKNSEDPRDIVHITVQSLVEGKLVAVPAETAYHVLASGLNPVAVEQLMQLPGRAPQRPPCIFLRSSQESLDYSPKMSMVANRIVQRGWPGPLVLQLPIAEPSSLAAQLPSSVRQSLVVDDQFLSQRVAAHQAIMQTMRLMPGPLVAAPLVDADGHAACTRQQVESLAGKGVALIVDDGPTHFGGFATALRIEGNRCSVVSAGVLDQSALTRLGQLTVLLVCTGNTCRSPMAEAILRRMLTERFASQFAEGNPPPAVAISAGLSAFPGGPASPEAIEVMKQRGLSLVHHQSRAVSDRLIGQADLVLTMTKSHRNAIVQRWPHLASKTYLLSNSRGDVSDPFGGPESVYAACAAQMEQYLCGWVDQIEEEWFPVWQVS